MPIPNHSIITVSSSDLPTLADFVQSSKLSLTINRLLFKNWPNEVAQKKLYTHAVESAFKDPSAECLKVVDDESKDIVGYLVITRKRPANIEPTADKENDYVEQDIPDGMNPDVSTAVSKAFNEIAEERVGIDHFKLTYIFVEPSSRKHGIGSHLVRVSFDKAKAEGIPLSVCSEPSSYDFFLNLGFADTRHVDIDLRKWAPAYSGFGMFRLAGMIWPH